MLWDFSPLSNNMAKPYVWTHNFSNQAQVLDSAEQISFCENDAHTHTHKLHDAEKINNKHNATISGSCFWLVRSGFVSSWGEAGCVFAVNFVEFRPRWWATGEVCRRVYEGRVARYWVRFKKGQKFKIFANFWFLLRKCHANNIFNEFNEILR